MSDNRCPNCGARMRLVKVVRVNSFPTPEARQYDLSVSRRNGFLDNKKTTSQELRCTCCSHYAAVRSAKSVELAAKRQAKQAKKDEKLAAKEEKFAKKEEKLAKKEEKKEKIKVSKADKKQAKQERKLKRIANKGRRTFIIKLIFWLIVLGVIAYFAYQYRDQIVAVFEQAKGMIDDIKNTIEQIKGALDQAKELIPQQ